MNSLKVALLQMTAHGNDQQMNLAKGEQFCREASRAGADIALFPEMWNIGYTPFLQSEDPELDLWKAPDLWNSENQLAVTDFEEASTQWQSQAVERDGPFFTHFQDLAKELNLAIALTYLERWKGSPRNSVSIIDRHGQVVLTYAKVHTCAFGLMEAALTPGDDFYVCDLDTVRGEVKVGAMICFDREFPESARILMLKGAELILTPNSCELEANRIGQFRARAFENMVGVALTNYATPQQNGHSIAFDAVAFDQNGPVDPLIIEAGQSEGIFIANFDIDRIREYRKREVWGNAFRKPYHYGPLTAPELLDPFIRVNGKGEQYKHSQNQ